MAADFNVKGIAGETITDDLGVDLGPTSRSMLVFFEHHHTSALAHDETVALLVVGARCTPRVFVEAGGERTARGEARKSQTVDRRFGTAGNHHVGIAELDQPRCVADGMRTG